MIYLFDTNHASLLWRGHPKLITKITSAGIDNFVLCMPSVAELWFMVYNSLRIAENEQKLRTFLEDFDVLTLDDDAAAEFGKIKAELRKLGRPVPDIDAQIAAIARSSGLKLLTADKHFNAMQGLSFENWL